MNDIFLEMGRALIALGIASAPLQQHDVPTAHHAFRVSQHQNGLRHASVTSQIDENARRPLAYREAKWQIPSGGKLLRFPDGFLWGVAVAGAQVEEGDSTSSWAEWERRGKVRDPKGPGTASWKRYEEDIALAARTGANAFRLSIEWSRVEPSRGRFDFGAMNRYVRAIEKCREMRLEPIVTLYHFSYPQWLDGLRQAEFSGSLGAFQLGGTALSGAGGLLQAAGWEQSAAPKAFSRYVEFVATALRGKVRYWITINEPNVEPQLGYLIGVFPPGKMNPLSYARATEHLLQAHVAAYDILHRTDPANQVSTNVFRMVRRQEHETVSWLPILEPGEIMLDRLAAWRDEPNGSPRRTLDYVAFDYYYAFTLPEFFQLADYWRWPIHPAGLYDAATYYYHRYRLPVLVAENGMATQNGLPRQDGWSREAFLTNHVYELQRAIADGVPVLGYCYWSLLDNYEWGSYAPTFGLYRVDRQDASLPRRATAAATIFRRLATHNGLTPDLIDRYLFKRS